IFNHLGITSNYDEYVLVDCVQSQLWLSDTGSIPPGYLFLCPLQDLQADIPSQLRHPESPAYWSLNPSGAERLSAEEAGELGFPSLDFEMKVWVWSWHESVYTGIRQFHQAKGYDPYSQDVARELGYPLFQVSSELDASFAHVQNRSEKDESERDEELSGNESLQEELQSFLCQFQSKSDAPCAHVQDWGKGDSSSNLTDKHLSSTEFPQELLLEGSSLDSSLGRGNFPPLDTGELEPSRGWTIIMGVQFTLILALSVLHLYDSVHSRLSIS
ncbi:hypothetical protein DFH09DRAFT_75439, partial [Mycena vulgaris]